MFDPAITGFRDQVGEIQRYAEMVIASHEADHRDRVMAEHVLRQAKGLWRQLDRWRCSRSPARTT